MFMHNTFNWMVWVKLMVLKHTVSIKWTAHQKDGSVCVFFKLMGSDERWVYLQVWLHEYIKM